MESLGAPGWAKSHMWVVSFNLQNCFWVWGSPDLPILREEPTKVLLGVIIHKK